MDYFDSTHAISIWLLTDIKPIRSPRCAWPLQLGERSRQIGYDAGKAGLDQTKIYHAFDTPTLVVPSRVAKELIRLFCGTASDTPEW